ncbi:ERI1 exoribonuclease 2 [Pelobates fuscus]|uniref:ERI1 exoribonuclease 2 n=1 Tax=Pelobates fuscus TaxID=191477 RepID=UPI002FE4CD89
MATKHLAKQLGLIRRSSTLCTKSNSVFSPKSKQFFEYLIIIDFESTCWKDAKHYGQEIIEFPAVLLNTSNGEIESEFRTYVQPQEHPILSDFCTELTGIKQQQVDEGIPLRICLSQFSKWIQKIQKDKRIVFVTASPAHPTSGQKLCAFVTWSDWDLGVCLLYECKRKQLRKPDILNSWIDLRATYKLFYNRKPKGLNGALQDLGIEFSGREHSGLDDSRNTAKLAWKMICDGCVMKITKSLDQVRPKISPVRPLPLPAQSASCSSEDNQLSTKITVDKDSTERELPSSHAHYSIMKAQKHDSNTTIKKNDGTKQDDAAKPSNGNQNQDIQPPQTLINGLTTTLGNGHKYFFSSRNSINNLENTIQIGTFTSTPVGNTSFGPGHLLISTTVSTVNDISGLDISSSSDCLAMVADWEDAALIEDSQENQNTESTELVETTLCSVMLPDIASSSKHNLEHFNVFKNESDAVLKPCVPQSNSVAYKSPDTTIYNVKQQGSNSSAFKLPTSFASTSSNNLSYVGQKTKTPTLLNYFPKRKLSSVSFYSPPKKQAFTIHEDEDSAHNSLSTTTRVSRTIPSTVLNSTVNMSNSRSTKDQRITAPMCKCGRRAKKLTVSNMGPNHGRAFYSCTVRKRTEENKKGCDYFKWEDTLLKEKSAHTSALLSTSGISVSSRTSFLSSGSSSASNRSFTGLRPSMRT